MVAQNPTALQGQMQDVREDLTEHASEAIQNARMEFDWRHYVASHPCTSLAAAMAAGYFLVPRRAYRPCDSEAVTEAVDRVARAVQPSPLAGMASAVLSAVAAAVARETSSWLTASVREFLGPLSEKFRTQAAERGTEVGAGREEELFATRGDLHPKTP
jgi:hypothetical protein